VAVNGKGKQGLKQKHKEGVLKTCLGMGSALFWYITQR
jgi:hypothetical protein